MTCLKKGLLEFFDPEGEISFTGAAFQAIFEFLLRTCFKLFLLCFCDIWSGLFVDLVLTIYCVFFKTCIVSTKKISLAYRPLGYLVKFVWGIFK